MMMLVSLPEGCWNCREDVGGRKFLLSVVAGTNSLLVVDAWFPLIGGAGRAIFIRPDKAGACSRRLFTNATHHTIYY
jgi:hypothetical protein